MLCRCWLGFEPSPSVTKPSQAPTSSFASEPLPPEAAPGDGEGVCDWAGARSAGTSNANRKQGRSSVFMNGGTAGLNRRESLLRPTALRKPKTFTTHWACPAVSPLPRMHAILPHHATEWRPRESISKRSVWERGDQTLYEGNGFMVLRRPLKFPRGSPRPAPQNCRRDLGNRATALHWAIEDPAQYRFHVAVSARAIDPVRHR